MTAINILVVEDEQIVAMDVQWMLQRLGYGVSGLVASGAEAVQVATATRPDLVLMDIRLEGEVDGIEAAEEIRRLNIPVIYLTAYADAETLRRAKLTQPYGYILKPFEEIELYSNIEMALYKHKMEQRLGAVDRWLATTLRSLGDAVITLDAAERVVSLNPAAELLLKQSQAVAFGQPLAALLATQQSEARLDIARAVKAALQQQVRVVLPHNAAFRLDEAPVLIEGTVEPMQDPQGQQAGAVVVLRDVTERRRAEAQRQAVERRLLEGQRLELIGQLARGVAHDFNNLLQRIGGEIELLRDESEPSGHVAEGLDKIAQAVEYGAELSRQLLMFARSGHTATETLDLNGIVRRVTGLLHHSLPQRVALQLQLAEEALIVNVDATQMQQVVMNLVLNGSEAIGGRGGTITVRTRTCVAAHMELPELAHAEYVCLDIADSGAGIEPDVQARIFEPFFTTKASGHGLGLAVVESIVQSLNGRVQVQSAVGHGTTFTVLLPVASLDAGAEAA